jgi:hypothetical protein
MIAGRATALIHHDHPESAGSGSGGRRSARASDLAVPWRFTGWLARDELARVSPDIDGAFGWSRQYPAAT